ncbi:MAG TPA: MopE-related protein, partial [Flavobacterium lutivivi]|nr:MopE-related protein [Flavobacterium lutivivi]
MQRIIILLFLFCFKMFGENRTHFFANNLYKETVLKTATKTKSLSIYYGTKNEGLNIQKYPFSKKIALPEFNNSFELDNLIPDAEYFFVVQSEDNELQQYSFKTGSLNKNLTTTPSGNEDFTVIALPDTQHYTWRSNTFQIFIDQTQWVINQKVNLNIVLVDHLGDIVDYSEPVQWQRARLALDLLNQNDIAIGVAPGNHDYDAIDAYTGQATLYDKNFPATTAISVADGLGIPSYEQYDWYGGYMGGTNDVVTSDDGVYTNRLWKNNYVLFSAGGMDFINIAMEFNFPFEAQQWLDDVLTAFPNRRAIISTHQFLRDNNTITSSGNVQAVLNNILAEHCNVFLILCAHNHDGDTPGVAELNLQNSCGKPVYIRMSNYQEEENGGDGYLRIMKFHPSKSTIDVTTYSPVLNQYKTDAYNQFTLQYDMSASTPITFNITSPEDHSVFDIGTTNIPISINASSIVDFVEFKLNGQTFVDNTGSNGVFSITTSGATNWLPEGTYIVEAIAHDNETSTTLTKQISITIGTLSKTLDVRIASTNNDAEEFVWNGSMNLTSSDLELYTDEGNAQQVGLRFQNITIPRGATITNAYVEFTVDELNSGAFSMKVAGEATDNSNVFNASQYNISSRTKTSAFVNWSPANWVAENDLHRTPNLSTIIQEITDRNGWNTGNSMSFIFYGNNNAASTRIAEAYDGETFSAPLLHVEYTLGNCQTRTFYADLDNDGYGDPNNIKIQCTLPANYVENNLDCNDNNASVNPNAFEIAFNNIDDDCNPNTLDNPTGIELEITSPTNNYIFNQGTSSISISATTNSVVDYVEFKLNGQNFVDNNNADTIFSVNASGSSGWLPSGNYIIEVTAYDIETSNSLSKQLNITIGPIFGNVDTRVNGSTNDAEENLFNNGSIDLGSSDLELFTESGVDPQQIGLRFQNISIPKNATITNAYIEFTVDEVTSGNVTVNISGEATDNSLAFQNVAYNISSRTKTSSTVAWNPTDWLNENDLHQTPDLKDLVQEIVNRTGWSSGNSMSFILYGGNVPTNTRVAESYEGENFSAPLLRIEYSIGACNLQTYYADNDHDGFGDANNSISDCTQPLNFVTNNTDCDDNNASVNTSAIEIPYNGIDDDCNLLTKDDDLDGDGFVLANDCDDNNASVNTSAIEIPYNGIDDDCNLLTKDDDLDGDGFVLANDCDDNNASVNASAIEIPYNGIDDDCNPLTKDDDLDGDGFILANDCDDNNASVNSSAIEIPYNGIDDDCNPLTKDDDLDGDGFILANDCDDNNASVNASAIEIPYNGIDDDCNPLTKDDDLDGDGFVLANDCDDNNAFVNISATEIPYNGIDDDCNPLTKDDDLDGDGFVLANDCDDNNASVNASSTEIPYNGIDDDCNPLTKDDDLDGDGFVLAND